jgi:hypothetical protein
MYGSHAMATLASESNNEHVLWFSTEVSQVLFVLPQPHPKPAMLVLCFKQLGKSKLGPIIVLSSV